jgi:hypothetical protein
MTLNALNRSVFSQKGVARSFVMCIDHPSIFPSVLAVTGLTPFLKLSGVGILMALITFVKVHADVIGALVDSPGSFTKVTLFTGYLPVFSIKGVTSEVVIKGLRVETSDIT